MTSNQRYTVAQAVADFLIDRQLAGRTARTVGFYREKFAALVALLGDRPIAQLDAQALRSYVAAETARGLGTRSVHHELVVAKTLLRWCHDEEAYGVESVGWLDRVKSPRVVTDPVKPLESPEIARLFAVLTRRDPRTYRARALLAVLIDTGLRSGEARGLTLADVDIVSGEIRVRAGTSKSGKYRTVWLGLRARREVQRYYQLTRDDADRAPGSPFFITSTGTSLDAFVLRRIVKNAGDKAGIAGLHPHRLRHTFTRACIVAGMDPFAVQRLLGHTDLTMTRRYFAQADHDVKAAKLAHSPLDRLTGRGGHGHA